MAAFSEASLAKLATLHPDLQRILYAAIVDVDFSILVGFRDEKEQELAVSGGFSEKHWPDSRHNSQPSEAVDVAPYPLDWMNRDRFVLLAGYLLAKADDLGTPLRWGGCWKGDWLVTKNGKPDDLGHFELRRGGAGG